MKTPLEVLEELGSENMPLAVTKMAEDIKARYGELFSKYASVHEKINHGRKMSPEEISEAGLYLTPKVNFSSLVTITYLVCQQNNIEINLKYVSYVSGSSIFPY